MEHLIQIISAGIASFGFSLVFRINKKLQYAFYGAIVGSIGWGIYLISFNYSNSEYVSYFCSTLIVAICCEILARIVKTPTTIFLVVAIFPLVPGGKIYQTMLYAIQGQSMEFLQSLINTFGVSMSIALAILISLTLFKLNKKFKNPYK